MKNFKSKGKYFILGMVFTLVLTTAVFAGGGLESIRVKFNDIKLIVDGKTLNADNILYKGKTYVPIRDVGESLGKKVDFDKKTKTANIYDVNGEIPPVTDSMDLVGAMKLYEKEYPNAKIREAKYKYVGEELFFEIDGLDLKGEYHLDISSDGKIVKRDIDRPDSDAKYEIEYEGFNSSDIGKLISPKEAEKIALVKIKSIFKGHAKIHSLKLEKDNGIFIYDVESKLSNGKDIDIKINAKTKAIVEIDD